MKTEWDLRLLYSSDTDPQIEKDLAAYEAACSDFEKKYRNSAGYLSDDEELLSALTDYEKMADMPEGARPTAYFHYRTNIDSEDQKAESELNRLTERLTKANNRILFFELSLGQILPEKREEIMANKTLGHFHYFLKRLFLVAEHTLSEPEEKILSLKSLPAHLLWMNGQQKLLSRQTVRFRGKDIPLPEALNMVPELTLNSRRKLTDEVNRVLRGISYFAESEINAVYTDKKINDELRGFKRPYSATILHYQNEEESVINFVNTVTRRFDISHRFYDVKAKLLKIQSLEYADRSARVGKVNIKLSFDETVRMLDRIFSSLGGRYAPIFTEYLKNGQIDVFPRLGKRGGAYCSGNIALPTFVLLNHVDNISSFKTIAHEMGHAFHTELSKSQTPMYQSYTTSVAEVASTLFENIAFDHVFENLTNKEKMIVLHDRINDDISTIFRQIACFNFELELHERIRREGALSKEDMAALHNKHMKAYLGPLFNMKDKDGYFFVEWPHLRYFFYVYSYAYGSLISRAMYKKYQENKSYLKEIEKFLSAGGSKSPEEIFMEIGIDTSKPEFFEEGLKSIEQDIIKLEALIKR